MQLFLDGSDIDKIRKYCGLGLIDGRRGSQGAMETPRENKLWPEMYWHHMSYDRYFLIGDTDRCDRGPQRPLLVSQAQLL